MSGGVRTEIIEKTLSLLKSLPKERIKHYTSFKDVQLEKYSGDAIKNVPEKELELQYIALRDLVNDKYKNSYKLDDKLLKPKGNPQYYDRILSELKGEKKETFGSALRTVLFGK
ncbi:Piso0_005216 [Millerozyma farinosa CBS 7064]|uniref:Piso0_005216 protein n=1 Tax=Pichia sorbitophila (strain ATCC MYA-4447 / BCRC 22081 / CBS 7064 / NBRC 10061 / NRRL Y-12695) TaxID=559304 RepID=G8Y4I4_PICSO|nr:Piso0_005216 [Millerozyma farinosa CBS 7064]